MKSQKKNVIFSFIDNLINCKIKLSLKFIKKVSFFYYDSDKEISSFWRLYPLLEKGFPPESQLFLFGSDDEGLFASSTSFPAFLLDEKSGESSKQRIIETVLTTRLKSYTAEFIDLGEFLGKTRWTRERAIMSEREHVAMEVVAMVTTRWRREDVDSMIGEKLFLWCTIG